MSCDAISTAAMNATGQARDSGKKQGMPGNLNGSLLELMLADSHLQARIDEQE